MIDSMLSSYFLLERAGGELYQGSYSPALVLFSYMMAVFAAYTTLGLVDHMRQSYAAGERSAYFWWVGASVTFGGGIFVMHFIAMLAFSMPIEMRYDLEMTLISFIAPIVVVAVALAQLRHDIRLSNLLWGALLMGVGVTAMHYTGMAAIFAPALLRYEAGLWILSMVIAITVSFVALLLLRFMPDLIRRYGEASRFWVAMVMGAAVAGMHYTGMAAAHFYSGGYCGTSPGLLNIRLDTDYLGVEVIIIAFLTIGLGLISTLYKDRLNIMRVQHRQQQEAQKEKDDFFATITHELRTPLTAIIGNSEHLIEGGHCGSEHCPQKGDAIEVLHSIVHAGRTQLALVNDILDMSKLESGKFSIEKRPYNLTYLLNDIEQMFRARIQDTGLTFKVDQRNSETRLLLGDSQRISQVLVNLIGNAIKFTEQGRISVTTQVEGEQLLLAVEDTGTGMSPETLDRIFNRYEQADGSISKRFGGTGLGLYISRNLAELMEGDIKVSSRLGDGSTFTLMLPYQRSDIPIQHSEQRTTFEQAPEEKLTGHVLVAEDTSALQVLERQILETIGLTVEMVGNGEEAVLLATSQPFDLILMDMQMPVMGGNEATRKIREAGNNIPVLALTAEVMPLHREQFHEVGGDGFIAKPIDRKQLIRELKRFLKSQPQNDPQDSLVTGKSVQPIRVLAVDDEAAVLELYQLFFYG